MKIFLVLVRPEMRMVRWMCNVKVKDRVSSKELRERLGIDDIILAIIWRRFIGLHKGAPVCCPA